MRLELERGRTVDIRREVIVDGRDPRERIRSLEAEVAALRAEVGRLRAHHRFMSVDLLPVNPTVGRPR